MFGAGEMLVIVLVAIIVVDPKKLPDLMKSLGKALNEFKEMSSEVKRTFEREAEVSDFEKRKAEAEERLFGREGAAAQPDGAKPAQGGEAAASEPPQASAEGAAPASSSPESAGTASSETSSAPQAPAAGSETGTSAPEAPVGESPVGESTAEISAAAQPDGAKPAQGGEAAASEPPQASAEGAAPASSSPESAGTASSETSSALQAPAAGSETGTSAPEAPVGEPPVGESTAEISAAAQPDGAKPAQGGEAAASAAEKPAAGEAAASEPPAVPGDAAAPPAPTDESAVPAVAVAAGAPAVPPPPPPSGDDAVGEGEAGRMSIFGHLQDLRKRLTRSAIAVLVGFLACYAFAGKLLQFLMQPMLDVLKESHFIYTIPTEAFFTEMKVAFVAGIFVASPYIFYQLWQFVAPGLYSHEKRWILPIAFFSALFFTAGALFGYFVVFPFGFEFFASYTSSILTFMPKLDEYLDFVLKLLFAFGIVFELPLFLFFLSRLGIVTYVGLRKKRKYAVLVSFVVAAALTPPDAVSQTMMAVPLCILYEVGIWVAYFFGKKPKKKEDEAAGETA